MELNFFKIVAADLVLVGKQKKVPVHKNIIKLFFLPIFEPILTILNIKNIKKWGEIKKHYLLIFCLFVLINPMWLSGPD